MGLNELIKQIKERVGDKKVFFTTDIDFVNSAYAPGTPEVAGFTSHETLTIIRGIKELKFVGFDIVEVLPGYDFGEITSYPAANIVFEFLSILALQKKMTK